MSADAIGARQEAKRRLRRKLLERRENLGTDAIEVRSKKIVSHLLAQPELDSAGTVALYFANRGEADLSALMRALLSRNNTVTAPRIRDGDLEFVSVSSPDDCQPGAFGIREPTGNHAVAFGDHDVVVVPLIGFDNDLNRLGYGGGFYDRCIDLSTRRPVLIGAAYEFQRLSAVPVAPWDQPLDGVVTEAGLTACQAPRAF